MNTNINSKIKSYNTHKTRRTVVLLTVIMISSLLVVGTLFLTKFNDSYLNDPIHVRNETELVNAISKAKTPTTIKLDNDITLTKTLTISNKKEITLTSNTTESFFKLLGAKDQTTITINRNGILHLAGITITHKSETNGLGVNVTEGGKLYMVDGEISGNSGNGRYSYGGGVAVYGGGFFEMTGGVISGNEATFGGGVTVYDGFFSMYGDAMINSNTVWEYGGGVYVVAGFFNMTDNAVIANNKSLSRDGGGVYNTGFFEMTGNSVIANNTTTNEPITNGYGGGVYVSEDDVFEMSSGKISGNFAGYDYGGVYNKGTFNQTGGTISGNKTNGKHPNQ